MIRLRVPAALVLSLAALTQSTMADAELAVHVQEARAEILPRTQGQKHTRLPVLQFSVRADFACNKDAVAESVTISVADAYKRYAPAAGEETFETDITVPRNQIAAVATGDFCMAGDTDGELLLAGVATAQVSLRCRSENSVSIRFASQRLPLRLVCSRRDAQDPSLVSSLAR